jgi:4-diphosphocytidyl-2-C-methyl-D-erythritol kinase
MASPLTLKSYAKLNLHLHVNERRDDGFHELVSLASTVELHDELSFAHTAGGTEIVAAEPCDPLPPGEDNIIFRAIERVRHIHPFPGGVKVLLTKKIPIGAGLGGGSSNGWTAIRGVDLLCDLKLTPGEKFSLSAALGSDVPLFIHGGMVLMTGRGEKLTPLPDGEPYAVVIVKPPFSVTTGDAYRWLDEKADRKREEIPASSVFSVPTMHNDFEDVLFPRYPALEVIKKALLREGCLAASLTGSGSALYGLIEEPGMAHEIAEAMRAGGYGRVIETRIRGRDERV